MLARNSGSKSVLSGVSLHVVERPLQPYHHRLAIHNSRNMYLYVSLPTLDLRFGSIRIAAFVFRDGRTNTDTAVLIHGFTRSNSQLQDVGLLQDRLVISPCTNVQKYVSLIPLCKYLLQSAFEPGTFVTKVRVTNC